MKHLSKMNRRRFVKSAALLSGGLISPGLLNCSRERTMQHPRIFISQSKKPGARSIDELQRAISSGHTGELWQRIYQKAEQDIGADPLVPSSMFPGRNEGAAKHKNPDYTICHAAGQRMLSSALATLLTGDDKFKTVVTDQMTALFDSQIWPDWIDQAHVRFGLPADLRTGMLSVTAALAFDWLYHYLTEEEKEFIIEGLDRRGIQPYLRSMAQDPWWANDMNNWLTVIVGGLGIAGMALGSSHPDSNKLIRLSLPLMREYMEIYGPEGEFNESVAYANATRLPVSYFAAYQCWKGERKNILSQPPFPQTCYWKMYMTLPPGRIAAFGDSHLDTRPDVKYIAAVASACQDPVLQWFYMQYAPITADPLQFLWYDPSLKAEHPGDWLPKGRAFAAHGACMSHRYNWDPVSTPCVIYGKAGREENHEHNDIGQLCVDGYGERLIVDLGSPSGYPADFFEENRWKYYNASISGHNVLMFDKKEMRVPLRERGDDYSFDFKEMRGRVVHSQFDDEAGCAWCVDLTGAYEGVDYVMRHVLHFAPGVIAVLDQAQLPERSDISLRWHTYDSSTPDRKGRFVVRNDKAMLAGRIVNLGNERFHIARGEHHYSAPFDKDRLGDPLEQRHESYIECAGRARDCRLLTLFSVSEKRKAFAQFTASPDGWRIERDDDVFTIVIDDEFIRIQGRHSGGEIKAPLFI